MGLRLTVLRCTGLRAGQRTNNGRDLRDRWITFGNDYVCVVNMAGPDQPGRDAPAVRLERNENGAAIIVPANPGPFGATNPTNGGNQVGCFDFTQGNQELFVQGLREMGFNYTPPALPVFDRYDAGNQLGFNF